MENQNNTCWGCRIDTRNKQYIWDELNKCFLRQGWGYNEDHDLRCNPQNPAVRRNKNMLNVKKGDLILVPRIPDWNYVTIVEATEDWSVGYNFSIDPTIGDYGHMFPAKIRCYFNRDNAMVKGGIRSTLHNRGRFWKIPQKYKKQIIEVVNLDPDILKTAQSYKGRFETAMSSSFSELEAELKTKVHEVFTQQFNATEWEFALVEGLKLLYPEPYFSVERVGGKLEKNHGSDIIIKFRGLSKKYEYIIAIQVKDYQDDFNAEAVINQINKANGYWKDKEQYVLIDKIVIVTRCNKEIFKSKELAESDVVHFIFAEDLQDILMQMAMLYNLYKH